jgi:hypothetical protein
LTDYFLFFYTDEYEEDNEDNNELDDEEGKRNSWTLFYGQGRSELS